MVMGLVFAVVLARGSILRAIAMILVGVLLSTVGTDLETGEERMTFGLPFLADGIDFAVLAMGIFGIAEIMRNLDHTEHRDVVRQAIGRLLPNKEDFGSPTSPCCAAPSSARSSASCPATARCSGRSPSYTLEKKLAKDPPLLAAAPSRAWPGRERQQCRRADLVHPAADARHPPNAVMALMVGAMTIHGIIPGPQVMTKNPTLFWA